MYYNNWVWLSIHRKECSQDKEMKDCERIVVFYHSKQHSVIPFMMWEKTAKLTTINVFQIS